MIMNKGYTWRGIWPALAAAILVSLATVSIAASCTFSSCDPTKRAQKNCTTMSDSGGEYYLELTTQTLDSKEMSGVFELSYLRTDAMFMNVIVTGRWTIYDPSSQDPSLFIMGAFNRRDSALQRRSRFGLMHSGTWESFPFGALLSNGGLSLHFEYIFTDEKVWILDGSC